MKKIPLLIIIILSLLLGACTASDSEKGKDSNKKQKIILTISAAASLSDCLADIEKKFNKMHPSVSLLFNFGGSGSLQQQILNGAPVDLYIFADKDKANKLVEEDLVIEETNKELLGNSLVLIVPKTSKKPINTLEDLLHSDLEKIAVGTPETVPAGKYTKQALIETGLWNKLNDQGKFVPTKDVRQVLTYVETNNVDAGFVYHTDAIQSAKVIIITEIPASTHDPIVYSTGVLRSSKHINEATIFSDFLLGEQAKAIFTKYGFKVGMMQ